MQDDHLIEEYRDDLNATHRQVLALLDISEEDYWRTAWTPAERIKEKPHATCGM